MSMRNWGGSKVSRHAYAPRDSPPSHTLLDQNLNPRVFPEIVLCPEFMERGQEFRSRVLIQVSFDDCNKSFLCRVSTEVVSIC